MPHRRQQYPTWADLCTPPLSRNGSGGGGGGSGNATSIQGVPVNAPVNPVVAGTSLVGQSNGSLSFVNPALSVSLSGGGAATFEAGAVWTPSSFTASPAANASGVTAASMHDSNGGSSNVLGQANPLASPAATYTKTTNGASVSVSYDVTQNGSSGASNNVTSAWYFRYYAGCDNDGTGSGAVADGNNATLVGGVDTPGALIGSLSNFGVGSTFQITPSGAQYGYLWCPTSGSAHTFSSGGQPFAMSRVVTNQSFTNQFGAVQGFDLYVSNQLTVAYTVSVST